MMFDLNSYYFQLTLSVVSIVLIVLLSKLARSKWVVIVFSILLSVRYLFWRALYTLNTASRVSLYVSLILLIAEIYGFIQIVLFFIQLGGSTNPVPPKMEEAELPTVDIFLPIYTEPAEILYRTIVGCQALDYPSEKKKIYVLDDGRRKEISDLAARLGCEYLTRADNKYAKAGNLNNGLKNSNGEIIAFFDCDQVPVRSFLKETVGFFKDPKVALVQTPQHFYNPDIFQKNLKIQHQIGQEQDLFFHLIQPGRDYFNSAIFCGSGGVIRRSALEEIGGFTQYAVIEDLPTSLELHAKGYRSVYLNKDLSAGLAPESCAGYINQRKRWTKAGVQIFLFHNPLFKKGLTLGQRLNYFATIYYFFHGIPRIVYLAWPLTYLLFNIPPFIAHIPTLVHYFLAHYIPSIIAINMVSKRHRNPFFNDVYDTIMSFPIAGAVFSVLLHPRKQPVTVTPKGERFEKSQMAFSAFPHLILFGLLLLGIRIGVDRFTPGYYSSLIICLFWAAYNALILLIALLSARERPQRRRLIRLRRRIACNLFYLDKRVGGHTTDISEAGCSLALSQPIALNEPEIKLELISNYGEITKLKGRVVRYDRDEKGEFNLGIKFVELDEATRQGIIRQMYSPTDSWQYDHLPPKGMWKGLFIFLFSPWRIFIKDKVLRRISPRFDISLACKIMFGKESLNGVARNISITGMTIQLKGNPKLPPKMDVILTRGNSGIMLPVKLVWQKQDKKMINCGVEILAPFQGEYIWEELGY
jgi:cellulose synthase (UDP-forming)